MRKWIVSVVSVIIKICHHRDLSEISFSEPPGQHSTVVSVSSGCLIKHFHTHLHQVLCCKVHLQVLCSPETRGHCALFYIPLGLTTYRALANMAWLDLGDLKERAVTNLYMDSFLSSLASTVFWTLGSESHMFNSGEMEESWNLLI